MRTNGLQTVLLRGLRYGVLFQRDRSLGEESATDGGSGLDGDHGLAEKDSREVGGGSNRDSAGSLPEDVLGLRSTGENDAGGAGLVYFAGDLEDPDIVGATRERDAV